MNWQARTELLLNTEQIQKLQNSNILIAGLGGVGAYATEQICRAGVKNISIVDSDTVSETNINRQLLASTSTIGKNKTELMKARLLDINPEVNITVINQYIDENNITDIISEKYDYVIDAIDTLTPKIWLIQECLKKNIPLVSSMGSGGKLDPLKIKISDISKTYNCKFARMIRKKLHKFGIRKGFKAVFSFEQNKSTIILSDKELNKLSIIGTISYMPSIFGGFCASVVINDIIDSE